MAQVMIILGFDSVSICDAYYVSSRLGMRALKMEKSCKWGKPVDTEKARTVSNRLSPGTSRKECGSADTLTSAQ